MSHTRLELIRPYPAWHAAAWVGRVRGEEEEVLAIRGPEGADAARLAREEQRLSLVEAAHPTMWLPRAVVLRNQRLCWVYPGRELLALDHAIGEGPARLPLAAAIEVLAHISEAMLAAGPQAHDHPGPTPRDVLVDRFGRVYLAGFVETAARAPSLQDPTGAKGEPALVYRLGGLLSWLVTGQEPERCRDAGDHDASVRRALIRVMSRPGPVVTERFANWFRALRAWSPEERPPLSRLPDALRQVADELGPNLQSWAQRQVDPMRARLEDHVDEVDEPSTYLTPPSTDEDERTDPGPPSGSYPLPRTDDPTQETPLQYETTPVRDARGSAFGMPVRVGPPPEVLEKRPALPSGFLDTVEDEDSDGVAAPGEVPPSGPGLYVMAALAAVSLTLIGFGALLLAYILGPPPQEELTPARIGEVLEQADSTAALVVRNPSGASLIVTCGDDETRTNGDAILPAERPDCMVTAELDGTVHTLPVQVRGIVQVDCFDGEPRCQIR